MAEVISISEEIDQLLNMLTASWEDVPRVAREIDSWDLIDQLCFTEEWPLEEMRLERLERFVRDGALTPEQMARYKRLKEMIARYRPVLRQIMEG